MVSQGRPEELDIVVDSGAVPAVIVSNLINYVSASVNSLMKPSVCTPVDFLPAASTQIIPVCSVPPDEKELEPTLGLEELFVSTNLVNVSVPPICTVAHADVITTGQSPADIAAVAVSAHEVELVSNEVSPLSRIIGALLPVSRAIEKIMTSLLRGKQSCASC